MITLGISNGPDNLTERFKNIVKDLIETIDFNGHWQREPYIYLRKDLFTTTDGLNSQTLLKLAKDIYGENYDFKIQTQSEFYHQELKDHADYPQICETIREDTPLVFRGYKTLVYSIEMAGAGFAVHKHHASYHPDNVNLAAPESSISRVSAS